jgi:hypothetical protein
MRSKNDKIIFNKCFGTFHIEYSIWSILFSILASIMYEDRPRLRGRPSRSVLLTIIGIIVALAIVIVVITVVLANGRHTPMPVVIISSDRQGTTITENVKKNINTASNQRAYDPCDGPWPSTIITVDYLVAGGGPGGLSTAADLSKALRASGVSKAKMSFAVVEKRPVFGGNLRRVNLTTPEGYSSTSPNGFGPLFADLGAQRINVLTLTNERRSFTDYNITTYCSPFRNIVNTRDRRVVCRDPYTQATQGAPYYDCAYDSTTDKVQCSPDPKDAFAYGDFCTYKSLYTDPVTGAFPGARQDNVNFTGCHNYDNTDDMRCSSFPNNDPSYDAYQWLLQGNTAPLADMAISSATSPSYDYGAGYNHPHDPMRFCNTTSGSQNACPMTRCGKYAEWRSFVAGELALPPVPLSSNAALNYNNGYANFLEADNVGFTGDYRASFGACSYGNYMAREWNTASHSCYPKGGMTSLTDAMRTRAEDNGVQFYANEPVQCIRRSKSSASKYEVRTATKTFRVGKFLGMAMPSPSLENPAVIGGDVLDDLRKQREFNRSKAARVASVVMQWPPGELAWWYLVPGLLDALSGNWSLRTYGDSACFSRIEIIDTPMHRCTNAIRAVYSDFRCQPLWTELIEGAAASNDWNKLAERVLVEIRDAFPTAVVPPPVLTYGDLFDPAWYWSKPQYDDISNADHATWATKPLGLQEPLCLIGEAYHIYYQGWSEGALRSSRMCLESRFGTQPLKTRIAELYAARDGIVPGTGWYDSAFQDVPPALGTKHFHNEQWWPWNYAAAINSTLSAPYCRSDLVGQTNYPVN